MALQIKALYKEGCSVCLIIRKLNVSLLEDWQRPNIIDSGGAVELQGGCITTP